MNMPKNVISYSGVGVYMIYDGILKKSYIGCSGDVRGRVRGHLNKLKKNAHEISDMQQAFNDHPEEFSFYLLHKCGSMNEARKLEYEEIISRNAAINGFNQIIPTGSYTFNRIPDNHTCKVSVSKNKVMKLLAESDLSDENLIYGLCNVFSCDPADITRNVYFERPEKE